MLLATEMSRSIGWGRLMNRRRFLATGAALAVAPGLLPLSGRSQQNALPPAGADGWISLLNGRDLSGWYGVLQRSGRGVAEQKRMVTMEDEMLHILGNEMNGENYESGYLATNAEFGNVRIRVEYKWGQAQFGQRAISKRDNGLLYGVVGADKVFPRCVECQIEEGDVGDFFLVDGIRGIQPAHNNGLFGINITREHGFPPPSGKPPASEPVTGRMIKDGNFEMLDGWNTVEVIFQGDRAAQIVNGRCVNVVTNLQQPDPANPGGYIPLTRGKIAMEIEFAEIWYRRIEVKAIG
jgi:hypothetical protein